MPASMGTHMRFVLDEQYDIVEAFFEAYELRSAADVLAWRAKVERELGRFGHKVDLLINLDGLVVRPAAAKLYGEHRSQLLALFANRSFRYGGDNATRTTVFTTSVFTGAEANVFPSRREALEALLDDRRKSRT